MRILHVIESLGTGGAERLLVTLLPELQRRGDEVAVAVLRAPLDLRGPLEAAGIPVDLLRHRAKWNLPALAYDIARCARVRGCDVVHAHLYFPAIGTALGRILLLHQASTAVTFHNLAYQAGVNKAGLGLSFRRMLASLLYPRGFDRKLGVSAAVAAHYRDALRLEAVSVLHNAVDLAAIDAAVVDAALASPVINHVVLPGRLVPEKGHPEFLQAVAQLRPSYPNLRVTIAGDGPLRAELEARIADLGLSGCVRIAGHMAYPALLRLLASAEVVATPSRAEGFGLTAVEAMAVRRPVVACAVGGLVEVVVDGETGLLVPPRCPDALATAIGKLLDDPALRQRLGSRARARVEECFALPAVASELRAVYDGMVRRRQRVTAPLS